MINRFKEWLKRREAERDFCEKARLCKPCNPVCGRDLCSKVGCLNMEMRTNATRLHFLVKRLEDTGYVFATRKTATAHGTLTIVSAKNVVDLNEYRNSK